MAQVKRFRHVGIVVKQLDKMLTFYSQVFDLNTISRQHEEGVYLETMLGMPGVKVETVKLGVSGEVFLELLQFRNPRETLQSSLDTLGLTHFALEVENVENLCVSILKHGGSLVNAPVETSGRYAKVAFASDPEGNSIEMVELL